MNYRIYPPIGIARLGNSPAEFFVGPETRSGKGVEILNDGSEREVTEYKDDDFKVKRQAARFRLFQFEDDASPGTPAELPPGTVVRWTVHLANKKDAVQRPDNPPAQPAPITVVGGRENRIIDSDVQTIRAPLGEQTQSQVLQGTYLGRPVSLGEIRSDREGRLLVLGGSGKAETFEGASIGGAGGFYDNDGWYDDVADGPVTATIIFPDGREAVAKPAWVIVAPPDFAPGVQAVVTLYDIIVQTAISARLLAPSPMPSFTRDIQPILQRASRLQWVHSEITWTLISTDWAALSNTAPSGPAALLRRQTANRARKVEGSFSHPGEDMYDLQPWQKDYLDKFVAGTFVADWSTSPPVPESMTTASLTRAVLDGTVGQTFFPGIEAGVILTKDSLYSRPFDFRLAHDEVKAGDLTALMALPWQADFLKCRLSWWPSQRPQEVPGGDPRLLWDRLDHGTLNHRKMVDLVMDFGVITQRPDQNGREIFEESRRRSNIG